MKTIKKSKNLSKPPLSQFRAILAAAEKRGHGTAADLVRIADRNAITLTAVLDKPELLRTEMLSREEITDKDLADASQIIREIDDNIFGRVRKFNARIEELTRPAVPTLPPPPVIRKQEVRIEDPKRKKLFGFPATAVIRWMGAERFTLKEAMQVLKHYKIDLSPGTVSAQLNAGKAGKRGEPAQLTGSQENEICDLLRGLQK